MSLKLRAEDAEDLKVVSAHLQDALVRVGDIAFLPRKRRLLMSLNRFCWECMPTKIAGKDTYQRVTTGLHLEGVLSLKSRGVSRDVEALLYLLSIEPKLDEGGGGRIEFKFAGGASLVAEVECLDATLSDLSEPWLTDFRPSHVASEEGARQG